LCDAPGRCVAYYHLTGERLVWSVSFRSTDLLDDRIYKKIQIVVIKSTPRGVAYLDHEHMKRPSILRCHTPGRFKKVKISPGDYLVPGLRPDAHKPGSAGELITNIYFLLLLLSFSPLILSRRLSQYAPSQRLGASG